jgi:hypothetical protein
MDSDEPVLNVCPAPHLEGGAEQDAHLALPHFRKQFLFPRLGVRVMDERDFVFGYAALYELRLDVVVYVEAPVREVLSSV